MRKGRKKKKGRKRGKNEKGMKKEKREEKYIEVWWEKWEMVSTKYPDVFLIFGKIFYNGHGQNFKFYGIFNILVEKTEINLKSKCL